MVKIASIFVAGFALFFFVLPDVFSRDINLDAIYLNNNSPYYNTLLEKKLTAYQAVNSQFIERDVIFAHWSDGFNIVYIKEVPQLNIIYTFNRNTRTQAELFRITGTITAVKNSASGKYIFIKRLRHEHNSLPSGETILLNTKSKTIRTLGSSYPFIDFSLSPSGNEILFETEKGIVEYSPELNSMNVIIDKSIYADIKSPHAPAIAYVSPNRRKFMLISGSGGAYRAKIVASGRSWKFMGITSASELFWLDNSRLIYRKGDAGNYSIHIYDVESHRSTALAGNSLNTNIQYSNLAKMVSFLQDQVIRMYDVRQNSIMTTGMEGEDISFSPDGNRFLSLYLKKLFINNISMVKRKNLELVKNSKEILDLYKFLLKSKNEWTNDYSPEYLKRKISVYGKIAE